MSLNLRRNAIAELNASGVGESFITNNNAGKLWIVRQISLITNPETAGCTCTVRFPTGILDTSYLAGTGDVAGGDPPVYLYSGDFLKLVWAAGPVNGQGICTFIFDEVDIV